MSPERWQQIEEQATVEHPPAARSAFLQQASGEDVSLRQEVEKLLAADTIQEKMYGTGTKITTSPNYKI